MPQIPSVSNASKFLVIPIFRPATIVHIRTIQSPKWLVLNWNALCKNTIPGFHLILEFMRVLSFQRSDKDTEPKRPLIVSHFPYGLLALSTVQSPWHWHWPVTSESNPFHSSEIGRPLGNVDSPTDLFLRVLFNRILALSERHCYIYPRVCRLNPDKAMISRPVEVQVQACCCKIPPPSRSLVNVQETLLQSTLDNTSWKVRREIKGMKI